MQDIKSSLGKIGVNTKKAIERFMGDEEMYLQYVHHFPDDPTMNSLVDAVDKKDYEAAEKAVHALKGIVSSLDFIPLADATVDMLEELRDGNVETALKEYENVKKQYKIACDVINTWRRENG
ncbi:MAG: Hpt domain-containing protein [Eubacteriales bacterium]|nr:Hpt domain-containing protein [Eubacteriales bacterium]